MELYKSFYMAEFRRLLEKIGLFWCHLGIIALSMDEVTSFELSQEHRGE